MSGGMQPDWKAALRTLVRTGAKTLTGAGLPSSGIDLAYPIVSQENCWMMASSLPCQKLL